MHTKSILPWRSHFGTFLWTWILGSTFTYKLSSSPVWSYLTCVFSEAQSSSSSWQPALVTPHVDSPQDSTEGRSQSISSSLSTFTQSPYSILSLCPNMLLFSDLYISFLDPTACHPSLSCSFYRPSSDFPSSAWYHAFLHALPLCPLSLILPACSLIGLRDDLGKLFPTGRHKLWNPTSPVAWRNKGTVACPLKEVKVFDLQTRSG